LRKVRGSGTGDEKGLLTQSMPGVGVRHIMRFLLRHQSLTLLSDGNLKPRPKDEVDVICASALARLPDENFSSVQFFNPRHVRGKFQLCP
jgi:hypothetical protein